MQVEPYLFFDGRCAEAIEFYKNTVGAEVEMLLHYKDSPEPPKPGMLPAGSENKVMHASLRIGDSRVLASDGHCAGQPKFEGVRLALSLPDAKETDRVFAALSDGGQVLAPLSKTFFSPSFGMVTDKFGLGWLVMAAP